MKTKVVRQEIINNAPKRETNSVLLHYVSLVPPTRAAQLVPATSLYSFISVFTSHLDIFVFILLYFVFCQHIQIQFTFHKPRNGKHKYQYYNFQLHWHFMNINNYVTAPFVRNDVSSIVTILCQILLVIYKVLKIQSNVFLLRIIFNINVRFRHVI